MRKLEGTAMAMLVEGNRLKRADILLSHYKRSLWGWLIRLGTRCYWNHALIIYTVGNLDQDYDNTLIIDPKMGSIHTDDIALYFQNPERYDVAIKRLDKEWFQNDGEVGGLPYSRIVCDTALRETADKFDTRLVIVGRRILRQAKLVYRFARLKMKYPSQGKRRASPIAGRLKISAYSCGGFVQWSYYQGVFRILRESQDKAILQDVIFNPRLVDPVTQYDLLSTTPADLARSDNLSWKYVVKDGVVWEVSSDEEVSSILKSEKKQR